MSWLSSFSDLMRRAGRSSLCIDCVEIASSRQSSNEFGFALEVVAIFLTREAGAGFVDAFEFTVAHDLGIGVVFLECAEEGDQRCALFRGAGIFILAFLVQASFVADANRMGVVMAGVHADLLFITRLIDLAILLNVVMVGNPFPVEAGIVTLLEHSDGEALVAAGGRTMDDDQ